MTIVSGRQSPTLIPRITPLFSPIIKQFQLTSIYFESRSITSGIIYSWKIHPWIQHDPMYNYANCTLSLIIWQLEPPMYVCTNPACFTQDVTANLPRLPGVRRPLRDEDDDDDVRSHKSLPAVMTTLTLQPRDKRSYKHSECRISLPPLISTRY